MANKENGKKNEEPVQSPPAAPEFGSAKMMQAFLPLVLVIGLKKLNLPEDDLLMYSRFAFAIRSLILVVVFGLIYLKVKNIPDDGKTIPSHQKNVGFGQQETVPAMTLKEYDNSNFLQTVKQEGIQIGILLVLHLKFGFVQPLLISSIVSLMKLCDSEIVKIYLFGLNPENHPSLKRPFGGVVIEEEQKNEDNKESKKDR
mmetsp:Transcript_1079/g.1407  ORF Transcript_1079/g.1407 Transcript_1079/m.1407 type:complete len:200 (+) Transcript_1079:147-746(+)|eukprot:CAMPEP_0117741546 /NCGR_PEP_ID=MMETSP0947-20121206/4987_1 /TAXON_ID=44440 /ORGANISM="Chattonella subsalsa, Strain CCMP2191" /LENGTH=199 /DNA_ID=CAMNT_0005557843 /DNA_START=143 /DNA_END=742 /DNA_ORIENTATION=-